MRIQTRNLVVYAMLGALAYLVMLFGRIPIVAAAPFLKYDPKDVVLAISSFLYGPLPALAVTLVVSFIEMVTVSTTGLIGLVMNIISSAAFICPAAFLYKRNRRLSGAVIGLILGCLSMTGVMLLWNYILTPLYMQGVTREQIAPMLVTVFLPFNLVKSMLNASITMILYKPIATALRRSNLYTDSANNLPTEKAAGPKGKPNIAVLLISLFIITSAVMIILILQNKI